MNFSPSRPRFSTNPSITTATTTITPSSSTLTHSPTLYFPLASNSSLGHVDETNESLDISSMEALQPPPVPPRPTHIRKDWNPLGTADGFSPSKSEGDGVPPPPIPPRMKKKTSSPPTTTVNTSLQGGGKIRRMSIDTALGISSPDDQEIPKEREDVVMKDGDKIPTDTTYTGSLTSKPDLSRAQSGMSLDTGTPTGMTADAGSVMSGGITPAATATATGEGSSRRRPLPPRPHHPPTEIPPWDPDTKSHIPASITLDSRQNAYTSQSTPPTRLRSTVQRREDPKRVRAGMLRRPAEVGVVVDVTGKKGLVGEWVLDPCLNKPGRDGKRPSIVPKRSSRIERLTSRRKRGSISSPTAVFTSASGDIDIRLGVVNQSMSGLGFGQNGQLTGGELNGGLEGGFREQVKAMEGHEEIEVAKVKVATVKGHVRVELAEMDPDRSINLEVSSKHGMVFVLLPPTFRGPIQCSTPVSHPTVFLPALKDKINIISSDRGDTIAYLGTPTNNTSQPFFPHRRTSDRLRGRPPQQNNFPSSLRGAGITLDNNQSIRSSPVPMDVDQDFHLPTPSRVGESAAETFIPSLGLRNGSGNYPATVPEDAISVAAPSNPPTTTPESTLFITSYSSSITIGLYGQEQPIPRNTTFAGLGSTLTGLMDGLEGLRCEMNRVIEGGGVGKGKGRVRW